MSRSGFLGGTGDASIAMLIVVFTARSIISLQAIIGGLNRSPRAIVFVEFYFCG